MSKALSVPIDVSLSVPINVFEFWLKFLTENSILFVSKFKLDFSENLLLYIPS